ncbi:hypothetical protein CAPTEDRAFT_187183 [Capitella teleta]|uniref:Endonuclease/exonuclease/phosphatase domain-containing protein n=1 Tax=Capitella teleta TaxID=283909 RepID=R7VFZ4_CAPTE|nr:hypothetical protein CAPTEDRAFT_187183 [Capitella teleta]|eukprot:ELU15201.1 hypothetical protein CAPTEDRAFT_187183 [Capitella teleta]
MQRSNHDTAEAVKRIVFTAIGKCRETWLTGSEKDDPIIAKLVPNGYIIHNTPRENRGGGTAIIHRSSLNVHQTPLVTAMSELSTFKYQECLLSEARTLRLCIVYRSPNNRSHTMGQFFEKFSNPLEVFSIWIGHILIAGDLNFHMDDSADRDANKLKALISSFGLEQHVKQSTHRSGHILDIVITRADNPLVSFVIAEDCEFPDHFPVFIETVLDKPQARKKMVSYRSIKRIDSVALKTAILHSHLADMNSDLP